MTRLVAALLLAAAVAPAAQEFSAAADLDAAIEQAIHDGQLPGAVLLVGQNGRTLYRKAYGMRSLVPTREPMTVDTIFDVASLTKVLATTPCIMKLFERGKVRLRDRVTVYLPEFEGGSTHITVRDLMTHFSGLRPDLDLEPPWHGYETGIAKALVEKPVSPPGERFLYSDINFILVGEIVRRLSGESLADYAAEQIYKPLGMSETRFLPPKSWVPRIAPTQKIGATVLRGVVHDPTSRDMGGVAGHAGLFSTADDMAKYAEMMIGMGARGGVRIFQPPTVRKFTEPQSPPHQPILRGLGWDIDSPFSGNRGELFPLGSYGHTGFTGTSLWIDPYSKTYVILLANSVHPDIRPAITSLRSRVATIVAAAVGIDSQQVELTGYYETATATGLRRDRGRNAQVKTGLDVLEESGFKPFRGKRVGLITNQTGVDRGLKRNIDVMRTAGVNLTALFSPEHGISGQLDTEHIGDTKDPATGIPIYSLYQGSERRPPAAALKQVDVLVFDIQDVGARFYTYGCTMKYAMQAAAHAHLPFFVLDRPNPINGATVEGPMLDAGLQSFVGCFPMPVRHGMTLGELARMMNGEEKIGADLTVVKMENWDRADWWDSTGLPWVNPSPNMRSLNAALLYPALAVFEASPNLSVGRGTEAPFEQIGADWINGEELAHYLNSRFVPGVRLYPVRFEPAASHFAGRQIEGVRFVITDREAFSTLRLSLELGAAFAKLYPGRINWEVNLKLFGSSAMLDALRGGRDPRWVEEMDRVPTSQFRERRAPYLLYP